MLLKNSYNSHTQDKHSAPPPPPNWDWESVCLLYCLIVVICLRVFLKAISITTYFIHPSGKLKLSFDRTTKNISIILSHETHAHTPLDIRPLSINLHTLIANPKLPGIMLSLSNQT